MGVTPAAAARQTGGIEIQGDSRTGGPVRTGALMPGAVAELRQTARAVKG
jgi:hypothetical protein